MAFRDVSVTEIREVLRLWVRGEGLRSIERFVTADRTTIRRYVQAGEAAGLVRGGGEGQLTDELIGAVVEAVRPSGRAATGTPGSVASPSVTASRRGSTRTCPL